MIPKIKFYKPIDKYKLLVKFDDGYTVEYDLSSEISAIPEFRDLKDIVGLFECIQLDSSRTILFWNETIDISSDTLYSYGKSINQQTIKK